jgi:exosortase
MLTQPISVTSSPVAPFRRTVPWDRVALAAAVMAALLPFLLQHTAWLWARPHYQFFPLVLVGACFLAYRGLRGVVLRPGDPRTAGLGLAVAWLVLLVAVAVDSSWLGSIAGMAAVPALAYATGGRDLVVRLLPAWGLLWLLVPPPLDLDRVIIYQLQGWTTGWSSSVLDALGVFHVRAGNAIEIDGRSLLVEEACSGINSLFSVTACTLFLVLAGRRGWARGLTLMVAAVGWVLAANVARVVLVVVLETRFGVSAATGWRHEVLGLVMFAVAFGLVLSTDRLIAFLAGQRRTSPPIDPAPAGPTVRNARILAFVAVPAFLLPLVAYLLVAESTPAAGPVPPPLAADADLLPPKIGDWERTDYAVHSRSSGSYFGEYSHVWHFTRNGTTVCVSIDAPFPAWHDLTWCYVGTGWRLRSQEVDKSVVSGGLVEVRMDRPVNWYGYLAFCEFDRRGTALAARPGGTAASPVRHRAALARLGIGEPGAADPGGPVYQLQVFDERWAEIGPSEEEAVRELCVGAQKAVREAWGAGR